MASDKYTGGGVEDMLGPGASSHAVDMSRSENLSGDVPMGPSKVNVLLVDDERLSRLVVANMLEKCGYTVSTAESAQDVVDQLDTPDFAYNMIILDVYMPDISGLQVREVMVNSPSCKQVQPKPSSYTVPAPDVLVIDPQI